MLGSIIFSAFYNSYFQELQIKAVTYVEEIEQYAALMDTYLNYTARIKVLPTLYGKTKPIHQFYSVLDKETVIQHDKPCVSTLNTKKPTQ